MTETGHSHSYATHTYTERDVAVYADIGHQSVLLMLQEYVRYHSDNNDKKSKIRRTTTTTAITITTTATIT